MKKQYILGLLTGFLVSLTIAVSAIPKGNTIESCAIHLPAGHEFKINIAGKIDTTLDARKFDADFSLSDAKGKADKNAELQESVSSFVGCVSELIN